MASHDQECTIRVSGMAHYSFDDSNDTLALPDTNLWGKAGLCDAAWYKTSW